MHSVGHVVHSTPSLYLSLFHRIHPDPRMRRITVLFGIGFGLDLGVKVRWVVGSSTGLMDFVWELFVGSDFECG